jgi:AcrR family transcriptional regulator
MSRAVRDTDRRRVRGQLVVAETRREIFDAAHRLFVEHGYVHTTIPAIAAEAGVAVQTIYNTIGSKHAVLSGVVERLGRDSDSPTTVAETLGERIRTEPDPAKIVELVVDWLVGARTRLASIYAAVREAAAIDLEAAELEQAVAQSALDGYRIPAGELARRDALRDGLDAETAAAVMWSIGHSEAYDFLVHRQGWTIERYRRWLLDGMGTVLREPSPARR